MAQAVNPRQRLKAGGAVMTIAALLGALPLPAPALGPSRPFAAPSPALDEASPNTTAPTTPATPPRINGLRTGAQPAALIDGLWVRLGTPVRGGARLKAVEPPYAILQHANGRLEYLALDSQASATRSPQDLLPPAQVVKTPLP